MKQQNKNFVMNVAYQLLMYLFPLVTSAYISRALGSENLGIYSYVNSIVTVCAMFCLLGISNYGNREVAKIRDNKLLLSKTFSSIYSLQLVLSVAVFVIYLLFILLIQSSYKLIFMLEIMHIVSAGLNISWLFFGLEKFKITLTRNFVIKVVSFLFIIIFVKGPQDLWIYALIMSVTALLSQGYLLFIAGKYVDFKFVCFKEAFKHFKSVLILFIPVLAYSIYRIMDKTMLGAMCEKQQLGFYENAERIINIPIMVISALGTVMLPHMAHSIANKGEQYKKTIAFSMRLTASISCFSVAALLIVADDASEILFGSEFIPSGFLVQLLSTTIIASGWANVIRTQYLIPIGKDKIYVCSTILGAVINLVLNLIFIPLFGAIGACIGTIAAEFSIVVYQTIFVRKELEIKKYFLTYFIMLVKGALGMILIYLSGRWVEGQVLRVSIQATVFVISFIILNKNLIFKEFLGLKKRKEGE